MNTFINDVLNLYKTPEYQKLNAYYEQQTVYNMLGVERNENRHSKFIAWLLNPNESHSLKELPLRRFLSLVAALATDEDKCYDQEDVRTHLITGNYRLNVQEIKTEQSIAGLVQNNIEDLDSIIEKNENGSFKSDSQNRFDIWMLLQISFNNRFDKEVTYHIPIVLENKIYSNEGNATNPSKAQTVRYSEAMGVICNSLGLGVFKNPYYQPLMVYLTPSGANKPMSDAFIHIEYQQLLDYVITPASMNSHLQNATTEVQVMIDGYIRNLSCPASNDEKDYSILAIAQSEDESLEVIYNSKAFQTAFRALYYNEAKNLLEENFETADETTLVTDFWNSNENLFKVVLYNHCKNNPDNLKIISKVIKTNNRDNTRYLIGIGEDNWLNANGKPASKSEASYLIFKAYLMEYPATTLAELRKAFPCEKLNAYYYDRYYNDLFYESNPDNVDETGYEILTYTAGKHKGKEAKAKWDFYLDEEKLLPIENGQKNAMCVKMWRKGDFDKLVEFVEENYKFIGIEEC
jgi:hypothetical protein